MNDDLLKLKETWLRAWFDKDAATVDRLAAHDYVYVAPNGQLLDRDDILAIVRSPTYRIHNGRGTEVIVRPLGEAAALIRHRWQGEGSFEGTSFKDDHRCVMVCARIAGQWQIVFEQCADNRRV
jgi:Domain of unknown function (DUF4440)